MAKGHRPEGLSDYNISPKAKVNLTDTAYIYDANERVARLLATLMALQAGLPLLNFHLLAGEKKWAYFRAIRAGMDKDYTPMEHLFSEIITQRLSAS